MLSLYKSMFPFSSSYLELLGLVELCLVPDFEKGEVLLGLQGEGSLQL